MGSIAATIAVVGRVVAEQVAAVVAEQVAAVAAGKEVVAAAEMSAAEMPAAVTDRCLCDPKEDLLILAAGMEEASGQIVAAGVAEVIAA